MPQSNHNKSTWANCRTVIQRFTLWLADQQIGNNMLTNQSFQKYSLSSALRGFCLWIDICFPIILKIIMATEKKGHSIIYLLYKMQWRGEKYSGTGSIPPSILQCTAPHDMGPNLSISPSAGPYLSISTQLNFTTKPPHQQKKDPYCYQWQIPN